MKVRAYVVAVALAAAATIAWLEVTAPKGVHPEGPPAVLLGFLLICVGEFFQLAVYTREQTVELNIIDGLAAVVIVTTDPWQAVLAVSLGQLASNVLRRNAPLKTAFNVAQWALCTAVGAVIVDSARGLPEAPLLGVVVAATLAMAALNQLLLAGVLRLAVGSLRGAVPVAQGLAVAVGASVVVGACLTAAALVTPWTLPMGLVLLAAMHEMGRAQASLRADQQRLRALQGATHHLATAPDRQAAIPSFISAVRAGFEVRCADLVLVGGDDSRAQLFRCRLDESTVVVADHVTYPLVDALRLAEADKPVHVDRRTAGPEVEQLLERLDYTRALAAPLHSGERFVGALMLFDRMGVEGFEAGEMAVVAALARELVGFLERCALTALIEEERRKLADILDSTSDGIFSMRADGTITSWNAGFAAITGYGPDEMIGTRHFGLLRPRDAAGNDVHLERWLDTGAETATVELQVLTADATTVWLSCACSRLPGVEGDDSLVVVARNVSQARELERLKDDFVAIVSHELRTPLVPIRGWAQTLLNRGDRLTEEQRRSAIQTILGQSQRLESLVINILEASRIEAGQSELGDVIDVTAVCARVVEDMQVARPERAVRFHPPPVPTMVRGSAVWAERAVANLVANAVKYSPDSEPVDVAVTIEGTEVLVGVTDRGPGIPEESQERIFARFERLEQTLKQTGTGLGLYITRRMARAMGGDVTVSSMPGAGSTFVLRLPLITPPSQNSSPEVPRPRTAKPAARLELS